MRCCSGAEGRRRKKYRVKEKMTRRERKEKYTHENATSNGQDDFWTDSLRGKLRQE